MSREVRRVPVDWQHPIEYNPNWRFQRSTPYGRSQPLPRLHAVTEQFVPLLDGYEEAVSSHARERANLEARTGRDWEWHVGYHLTGWTDHEGKWRVPVGIGDESSNRVTVRDEDHLRSLLLAQHDRQVPNPADYMPVFDVPEDQLGWCLYQTVSEGTPVTPVFATAAELVDHLATVGEDHDQVPWPRASAERVVGEGYTFGSFAAVGGRLYESGRDAAALAEAMEGDK